MLRSERICREIVETEESYLQTLLTLQRLFIQPLRAAGRTSATPLLTHRQINEIFSNIEDIIKVNAELCNQLTTRMQPSQWTLRQRCVGDIFLFMSPFLKIYSVYVKNYQNSLRLLGECERKSAAFATFILSTLAQPECKGLGFQGFLLAPVQRIPRYKLLLEDLLKHTEPEHPDFENLRKALKSIQQVASFVNEMIREHEQMGEMLELQKSLSGLPEDLIIPGRRFLKKGMLVKVCRKSNKPRMFFLFSDILIYAAVSRTKQISSIATSKSQFVSNGNEVSSSTPQNSAFLSTAGSSSTSFVFHRMFKLDSADMKIVSVKDSELMSFCFQLKCTEKSFALLCSSEKEKRDWMDAIKQAIIMLRVNKSTLRLDDASPNIPMPIKTPSPTLDEDEEDGDDDLLARAPVWIPDNATITCMQCTQDFTMLRRRHHCRACGRVICAQCSSQKTSIPSTAALNSPFHKHLGNMLLSGPTQRVCDPCFQIIESRVFYLKEHLHRSSVLVMNDDLSIPAHVRISGGRTREDSVEVSTIIPSRQTDFASDSEDEEGVIPPIIAVDENGKPIAPQGWAGWRMLRGLSSTKPLAIGDGPSLSSGALKSPRPSSMQHFSLPAARSLLKRGSTIKAPPKNRGSESVLDPCKTNFSQFHDKSRPDSVVSVGSKESLTVPTDAPEAQFKSRRRSSLPLQKTFRPPAPPVGLPPLLNEENKRRSWSMLNDNAKGPAVSFPVARRKSMAQWVEPNTPPQSPLPTTPLTTIGRTKRLGNEAGRLSTLFGDKIRQLTSSVDTFTSNANKGVMFTPIDEGGAVSIVSASQPAPQSPLSKKLTAQTLNRRPQRPSMTIANMVRNRLSIMTGDLDVTEAMLTDCILRLRPQADGSDNFFTTSPVDYTGPAILPPPPLKDYIGNTPSIE